jgi:hypothetical protein
MSKYLQFCPKTGKFIGFGKLNGLSRLLFPLIGIAAIIWILIRVIPKPSRLTYPCVRTAMPIASGFIGYLAMLALSSIAFFRSKKSFRYYPLFFLGAFVAFGISGSVFTIQTTGQPTVNNTVTANQPMGVAKGIFPGRVVWVHDSSAVNQNCVVNKSGHGWYLSENNNQPVVSNMLSSAIHSVTGAASDSAAWRMIFQFYNSNHNKGIVNYVKGEKVFIKINATSAWSGNFNPTDLTANAYISETSVAPVLAVLRQLVNVVGVAQSDIYIGDPMKHIYKHLYDVWHGEFPNVHYLDNTYSTLGREKVSSSSTAIIHYSDKGTVLRTQSMYSNQTKNNRPVLIDSLYSIFQTADYVINIPQLKGHQRAGMTLFAKNHFGSQIPDSTGNADYLHMGLVRPYGVENPDTSTLRRSDYGMYRIQVDLMTHALLSGKNLIYILDALWGTDYELDVPLKWKMQPFNNQYTSSIFVSFDPVAIESAGYDFLRSEFTVESKRDPSVQMPGVDDYLHQAADSANWPKGIKYDPNGTGQYIASLGTHEHWNNATDKKYSRNLDPIQGTGIELIEIEPTVTSVANRENGPEYFQLYQNYPNPFNPSTTIAYSLSEKSSVEIKIFDLQGREIKSFTVGAQSAGYQRVVWNGMNDRSNPMASGFYVYRVKASSLGDGKTFVKSAKMLLLK